MLEILIKKIELFDNKTNTFINIDKDYTIVLEHSLVSISKWESKWHKPFLSNKKKTNEETLDYVKCMTLTQNIPDSVYYCLSEQNMIDINSYIENPMTATTFSSTSNKKSKKEEILTSELIYYWMIYYDIPAQYQKWHLNRLLTLIRICNIKNSDAKMSKRETMLNNAALNKLRKSKTGSRG